jgi:hypothetical protein
MRSKSDKSIRAVGDSRTLPVPKTMTWSKHSRRIDPISRSAKPFCQGKAYNTLVPDAHGPQSACDDRSVDAITVPDHATLNPSLSSSPWMRGAPQSWFSVLICRISVRNSLSSRGRLPAPSTSDANNDERRPYATARASQVGQCCDRQN